MAKQSKQAGDYHLPPKIDGIVKRLKSDIGHRIYRVVHHGQPMRGEVESRAWDPTYAYELPDGCPLKGYTHTVDYVKSIDIRVRGKRPLREQDVSIDVKTEETEHPGGCLAMQDNFCYLDRASDKHPQVTSRNNCPVYKRVLELLR